MDMPHILANYSQVLVKYIWACYNELIGGRHMATSYNKLWKLLIDKKISKVELRKATGISPNTMTKLFRDEPVMLHVLDKICKYLDCDYSDIIEYIPNSTHYNKITRKKIQED